MYIKIVSFSMKIERHTAFSGTFYFIDVSIKKRATFLGKRKRLFQKEGHSSNVSGESCSK
jgi:hypothetical protein